MNTAIRERKNEWQRNNRAAFQLKHGYSTTANYGAGGLREQILNRDSRKCIQCGMTEDEHISRWGRPITIDHKDRDRRNNARENLQTLCLSCHGRKDQIPALRRQRVPQHKNAILTKRAAGETFQRIADDTGFSIGAIWKWVQQWEKEKP